MVPGLDTNCVRRLHHPALQAHAPRLSDCCPFGVWGLAVVYVTRIALWLLWKVKPKAVWEAVSVFAWSRADPSRSKTHDSQFLQMNPGNEESQAG